MCRAALASSLLLAGCSGDESAPVEPSDPDARPDVVLVLIDTLRADHLGAYGYSRPTSPAIDALATRGLRFERAYSHSGWTLPSVASLLTGLHPHEHGAGRSPTDAQRFGRLNASVRTLAQDLADDGYATGAVVNNTFMAPEFGLNRGFESWDYRGAINAQHRSGTESVERGLAWLDAAERPVFLLLHLMEPHLDYAASEHFRGLFTRGILPEGERPASAAEVLSWVGWEGPAVSPRQREYLVARYDEAIRTADAAVAELVAGLEARGRLATTLLVVTSDHGEELWDHGGFEHGHSLHAELTRVPLIVAGPGIRVGVEAGLVSHRDLYWGLRDRTGLGGAAPEGACGVRNPFAPALGAGGEHLVLMENTMRGAPRAAAGGLRRHLELRLDAKLAELWEVDGSGRDLRVLQEPEEGRRLLEWAALCRAGLDAREPESAVEALDEALFEQLRALGYLRD